MSNPALLSRQVTSPPADFSLLDLVSLPTFALESNANGQPVYAALNKTALEIAGKTLGDVIGKTAAQVYGGRFGDIALERHRQAFSTGLPMSYQLTLPIGKTDRIVRTQLKPLRNSRGELTHVIGTSEDFSADRDMNELKAHAISMSSEMEQFVTLAAHDLRSPMRRISMLADILRDEIQTSNEEVDEALTMLEQVASKSMLLIADVISHAQATNATESVGRFSLRELCEDLMVMLDPAKLHSFSVEDVWLMGDKIATQLVLRNLIDNAIKHNEGNTIEIRVKTKNVLDSHYQIQLADNGRGIAEGVQVFLDGNKARSDSGFGLMGIKRLVNGRGGKITSLNQKTGQGAEFLFTLPGRVIEQ